MNDSFRRMAGGACITATALLPVPLSAQVVVSPSAPTVPGNGWRPTPGHFWHHHQMPPGGLTMPFWGGLVPFAGPGAAGSAAALAPSAVLNGNGTPSNLDLMGGTGNGNGNGNTGSNNGNGNSGNFNGNGNIGSNNGNGNSTNGNGNFGIGNGVGNGGGDTFGQ